MMQKIIPIGGVFAFLAVGLGAFGAHGLKAILEPSQLAIFETGVRYQFYHAIGILIAGVLYYLNGQSIFRRAAWFFGAGIFLFSGSLYLLACRFALGIESWTWLGPITPIGGVCFMVGWGFLVWGGMKMTNEGADRKRAG